MLALLPSLLSGGEITDELTCPSRVERRFWIGVPHRVTAGAAPEPDGDAVFGRDESFEAGSTGSAVVSEPEPGGNTVRLTVRLPVLRGRHRMNRREHV